MRASSISISSSAPHWRATLRLMWDGMVLIVLVNGLMDDVLIDRLIDHVPCVSCVMLVHHSCQISGSFLFKTPDNIPCVGCLLLVCCSCKGSFLFQTPRRGTNTIRANGCGKHLSVIPDYWGKSLQSCLLCHQFTLHLYCKLKSLLSRIMRGFCLHLCDRHP